MALVAVDCQCYGTMPPVTFPRPLADWPGWARVGSYGVLLLVGALVATLIGGAVAVRRPLPQTSGTLRLDGLSGRVEVARDAHGVPQVYAGSSTDLFFAQGFVQAQDRFFEMDFRRHVTAGRLSEMLGKATVETDMYIRTMGWRRVAAQEYDLLEPASRAYLDAFSAGVNAYLKGKAATSISAEYTVLALGGLDYQPEKWSPIDSLAWLKAMAWDLRGNMDDEVARSRLAVDRTPAQVEELYPRFPYDRHAPIVATGTTTGGAAARPAPAYSRGQAQALEAVRRGVDAIPDLMGRGTGIGSNSWVVSGAHTVSGKPLLANDPHLSTSLPGVWYQMGLHCTHVGASCPFDVSGFTFSGVPGVVIGHDRDVAWGFTNLNPDVTDLYLEKITGQSYLYDGKQVPLEQRDEVIRVAGSGSRLITVRSTRHGPLLSDVSAELSSVGANAPAPDGSPDRGNGYAVALSWTALTPRPTADAIFGFDTAHDWASFRAAARSFAVPSQNLVYADTAGHIGYQAPGAIPIRKGGRSGDYPAAGWLPADDWTGRYVPFEELPSSFDPPEGYVVTANQAVTGPDFPYALTPNPDQGYRSQRIRTLLDRRLAHGAKLDVRAMGEVQGDTRNPMAPVLVPYLVRQLMTSEYYADGQRLLVGWDFTQPADSAAAAYFDVVWRQVLALTFHDQLPRQLWPDGGSRWMAVVTKLLREPRSQWWDDATTAGVVEDRDTILAKAMRAARDELTRRESVSAKRWTWGRLHRLALENQSLGQSKIGLVRALFNRGPFPVGGGGAAVDATSWDAADGYAVTTAPSMRMVVDLAALDRSRWVTLTGTSGHLASPHYRDQTDLWVRGETLPWAFSRSAVRAATQDRLVLEPAAG
ncbi:MAG: penicillin acylase family protein [Marmoricola sp.]|nr:penicillin acylase family protein [Marmoricola sp.]